MNVSEFAPIPEPKPAPKPAPTLAELLAARATERAEEERQRQLAKITAKTSAHRNALDMAITYLDAHLSPALAEALSACADVDRERIESEDDDMRAIAGYIQLDIKGDDDRYHIWKITREWKIAGDWSVWILRGPGGYTVPLPDVYDRAELLDRAILDGIAAYPAWLDRAEERRAAAEAQERAREECEQREEERRKRQRVARYVFVSGVSATDLQRGVLAAGTHLQVTTLDPRGSDGAMEWRGILQAYNAQCLLLNVDGARAGDVGAQRLIPFARVLEILPLPDLAADLAADPDPDIAE